MIRKARQKDASRIAEILIFAKRISYRDIFKNDKITFGEMQVLPLALKLQSESTLLDDYYVYDDEFVKGLMKISKNNNEIEINELYVDPFFKGQGIGKEFINFLNNFNNESIVLWVLEKNLAARRFYENNGFVNIFERKIEDGTIEYILKYCKKNQSL